VSDKTLRYAVVGAGGFPGQHIERIDRLGPEIGCELAAVTIRPADRQPGQVEEFERRGVAVFDDAGEMFDALAGKVDAVFIPTSIHTHADLTCAALRRDHVIYLEKPPAATVQEVDRMIAAEADSDGWVYLGFQAMFSESLRRAKARVVQGAIGRVQRLRCWGWAPRPDKYYRRNEWAGRTRRGDAWVLDGPMNNALAHQTAAMLYLASDRPRTFATPSAVRAELYHARDIEGHDTFAAEIRTAEGPVTTFAGTHCPVSSGHEGPWSVVEGTEGRIEWRQGGPLRVETPSGRLENLESDPCHPMEQALVGFTAAVRAGDPELLACDLGMGRNYTLAINGAYESAGRVRPVPAERVGRTGEGEMTFTLIDGIDEAITRCGREGKLFSDIGVSWAETTEPFDLDGYDGFPRRFGR
jgi:predicted dehydrogenase